MKELSPRRINQIIGKTTKKFKEHVESGELHEIINSTCRKATIKNK